jgi:hypothetical protein
MTMSLRVVLPSITTAGANSGRWESILRQIDRLGIKECALFLTGIHSAEERQQLYLALTRRAAKGLRIPFVHARSDMAPSEYFFLRDVMGTQRFNLHPTRELPLAHKLPKEIRAITYIENTVSLLKSDLRGFAGICLDVSHLEDYRRQGREEVYRLVCSLAKFFGVGASHVSAVRTTPYVFKNGSITFAPHKAEVLSDFDYIRNFPRSFFGKYVALELENSLREQLEIKKYIEETLWTRPGTAKIREEIPAALAAA